MRETAPVTSPEEAGILGKAGARRWVRFAVGIVVTAVFILLIGRQLSFADLSSALTDVDPSYLAAALACVVGGYAARILRWWVMVRAQSSGASPWDCAKPFMISIAVNNVAPFRAGDVVRVFAFRDRIGIGPSEAFGTLIVERILDLCLLLLIFYVALQWVPDASLAAPISLGAGWLAAFAVAALVAVLALPSLTRRFLDALANGLRLKRLPLGRRLVGIAETIAESFVRISSPRSAISVILLTTVSWLLEGGVFVFAMYATHLSLPAAAGYFALATATLSTLIPSSPGYVGTFHYFAMLAVTSFSATTETAVAFAILVHLILWGVTTAAGGAFFALGSLPIFRRQSSLD